MATTMIVSSLPEQAVFCSINSVRRHCWARYRKHKFDNYVYVGCDNIMPMARTTWPKGDEWFVMSLPPASRISWENPLQKADKGRDDRGKGISDVRATEGKWHPQGSRC